MSEKAVRSSKKLLVSVIAALLADAGAMSAYGQEEREGNNLEEITVTGSRIRQSDGMVTPIPVTVMTTAELTTFEPGGTIAEQLDGLPQFFGTQTAQRGGNTLSGNGGGSYLDMRSLGTNRTLVLFDGARMTPMDKRGSVNIDTFPTALIRTVDVVTGGASAAYGADALGGVTNFILDREFEGLKFEVGTGITEQGDGERWNFSIAGGKKIGDRLNVIGSLEARHIARIWRNPEDLDPEWYESWGWVTNPEWTPTSPRGVPQRLTLPMVAASRASPTGLIWAKTGSADTDGLIPFKYNGQTFLDDGSATRPFNHGDVYSDPHGRISTRTLSGGPEALNHIRAFDAGPDGREVVGRSGFAAAQYQFNESISGFAQFMVGRSESNFTRVRGNSYLGGGQHANIFRNNAYLPEDIGLAMDEAGIDSFQLHKAGSYLGNNDAGRGGDNRGVFTTYTWSVGFNAVLPNDWDLKASWQSGESHKRTGVYDEIRSDRMFLAMDAVRDPATGAIVCNVQLYNPTVEQLRESVAHLGLESSRGGPLLSPVGLDNTIRDCVPYNVMGAGNMSKAAEDYLSTPMIGDSLVTQDFAEVLLRGDLFEGWSGPISFAAGLTYREQEFSDEALPYDVDVLGPPQNAPELGIRGISVRWYAALPTLWQFTTVPNISGKYDVWEAFGEVNVPVWESASGNQRLDTSLAYRSSDYSTVGRIESWKLGMDFQLFEDLRFRATKSRDVREANFGERFDVGGGGGTVDDPRFNNANFQIVLVAGGNPNLKPEVADTVVAGLVYQPAWLSGFRVSSDWYQVKISDSVGTLGAQRIVNECEAGAQALCAQIERDASTGTISKVWNVFLNVDQAMVEGVDIELGYQMEPDFISDQSESLTFRALGGYIIERSDTPLGGAALDVAGSMNTPEFTGVATLGYTFGPYGIQLQQNYIDSTIRDINWVEGVDVDINTVDSASYTNLRLSYNGELDNGGTWNASFNVTNLLDKAPPLVANSTYLGGAQLTHNNYDVFGRRYQVSLAMNF